MLIRAALFVVAALAATAAFAQSGKIRAKADVNCKNDGLDLDCTIKLTNAATGAPLAGVNVTVGADMPSMPMMHNVPPVKAAAGAEPGSYRSKIELEMSGEWALSIDLSGPVRDRVIKKIRVE
ncbi:MAG: FixH family protein [Pseudorhodoplanes sp.]|nr:FixH family protein [Pseudorhodoplanes sp.]